MGSLRRADKLVINHSADVSVNAFHQLCLMNVIITQVSLIAGVIERSAGSFAVRVAEAAPRRPSIRLMSPQETRPIPLIVMPRKRGAAQSLAGLSIS